jgi:formylglycine-generating enzyme required for sulfatase activity
MHFTTSSCLLPWCLVLFGVLYWVSPRAAAERVALVIGNADYKDAPLRNPVHDAHDVAQALRALGFEVLEATNINRRKMIETVTAFGTRLQHAQVSLFYYSGHGVQYQGSNYLIPLQTVIRTPTELEHEAMDVRRVLGHMQQGTTQLNIVILDACRDNPFRNLIGFRSYGEHGLARLPGVRSALIAYATQPDNTAADGTGRNGTYTKHLLRYLKQPGLTLPDLFSEVGRGVLQETNGQQEPWVSFSPLPRFCLAGCEPSAPAMSPPQVMMTPKPPSPGSPGTEVAVGSYPPAPEARLAPTFRNSIGMEFVLIPAGEFRRGSDDNDTDLSSAKPVHKVRISRPFYVGKYEVTQAEWQRIMGNNPNKERGSPYKEGHSQPWGFVGDRLPVTYVSWHDVQHFIQRLNTREGGPHYRLPTEAEWEWAARGSDGRRYPWGNQFDGTRLNGADREWHFGTCVSRTGDCMDNASKRPSDGYGGLAPVGSFEGGKSPFGVYDMVGNVMEWVQDVHGPYPRATVVDPTGPPPVDPAGKSRVVRGYAFFHDDPVWCQSAKRFGDSPQTTRHYTGFRLLKEAP